MHTGRSLTVCRSLLPREWGVCSGGICSGGFLLLGGCLVLGGVCSGGVCMLRGFCCGGLLLGGLLPRGVCSLGVSALGGCLLPGEGVSALGGVLWGVSAPGGMSALRRCLLQGVSALGVWYPSMHWGRHPPVNRMTDRCKNITLATTSLWPVTRKYYCRMHTTCLPIVCASQPLDVSTHVVLKGTSLNRSPVMATRCH